MITGLFFFINVTIFPAEASETLCTPSEVVVFSCVTKRRKPKRVSLCAKKEWSAERGYLVYRYGRKGKIELEYPKNRLVPRDSFKVVRKSSYDVNIGQDWTPGTKRVETVSIGFAFTPSNVTYQIMQTDSTSTPVDAWDRYVGDAIRKTSHALKVLLPKRTITIPCKNQQKYSIASAVAHFTNTLLPPNEMTACRKGESNIFDCKSEGNRASICRNKDQGKFARLVMKDGGKYSFLLNPTHQNPLKLWKESYVRHQTYFVGFDGSQGSVNSTGGFDDEQEGAASTTFFFQRPKINLSCSKDFDLKNLFPGVTVIDKS